MPTQAHRTGLWAGGLKTAVGFALTLTLLLLVNFFVYQKMRQLTATGADPAQADELLRLLAVTNLFVILFLSALVLLLNRQLTLRDAADRTAKQAHHESEHQLHARIAELTNLNQALQAENNERRRTETQLKHFQKMESLGKLVGSVSHEFNNYLTVILGYSEQLMMQLPPSTMEHSTAAEINRAGERSADLTRSLLGLVRGGEGAPRSVDVNRQVDNLRRMLNVVVGKRVRLEIMLQSDLPLITAVPGQLEQVLLNLAANARDAMPDGGRLAVETRAVDLDVPGGDVPPGHYVLLSVSDTGCGFDEETRQRMFEPFYTTKEHGTGLGLATVREIVLGGGGRIVADSAIGQGTTFKIYWPALPGDTEHGTRGAHSDTLIQVLPGERGAVHR